jgi:ATP-binding cassette, subfamily C, bacterial CydD
MTRAPLDPIAPVSPVIDRDRGPGPRLTSRRLRLLTRPRRRTMGVLSALAVVVLLTEVATALATAVVFDRVLRGSADLASPLALVAGLAAFAVVLQGVTRRAALHHGQRVRLQLRRDLFTHLARLGPGHLAHERSGALEAALTDGVDGFAGYCTELVPRAVATAVVVTGVIVAVLVIDPVVGLIMAASALVVVGGPVLSARAFGAEASRFAEVVGRTAAEYLDAVQGIVTLQAFGASRRWADRLQARQHELAHEETALGAMANMHVGFAALAVAAGTTLTVAVGVTQTTHDHLSGGSLLAILVLSASAFWMLTRAERDMPRGYRATSLALPILDLFDTEPAIVEPVHPAPIHRDLRPRSLSVDGVTFRYDETRSPALRNVSFSVAAGQLVVLAGPSGAGKSTLVALLMRFFDPQTGTVRVDGHDLRDLAETDRHALITATFQDAYLFNRSVAANLCLARPDATEAELHAAARGANAHDFITALPDGYDTVVGERGRRLSGGERQRLALATALVSDAPVVLLDEPTAGVDAASERLISEAITRMRGHRTVVLVTHHAHPELHPDQVITLDRGERVTG